MENDVRVIGKITMRTIKVQPSKHANEKGASIAKVYGQAFETKEVIDKVRGDVFVALVGNFEAVNEESGEVFRSGVLYLPAGIHDMLTSAVSKKGESEYVQFALDIRAVKASNPAGYSYEARSLTPASTVDPLDQLRNGIAARLSAPESKEAEVKKAETKPVPVKR